MDHGLLDERTTAGRCAGRRRSARSARLGTALAAALLVLAGCGDSSGDTAATTSTTKASTTTDGSAETTTTVPGDDASCVDGDAVAEVVGGPVERDRSSGFAVTARVGVSLGSEEDETGGSEPVEALEYQYEGCSYTLTEGGQGEVSITRLASDASSGPELYAALEGTARAAGETDGFSTLEDDLGDDAYRDGTDVVALTDTAMVFVSWEEADGADSFDRALELAPAMVEVGLVGDGETVDCDAVSEAVPTALGPVDDVAVSGGSIGIGDLDLKTQGCRIDLADGSEARVRAADPDQWDAWVAAKQGSTFTKSFAEVAIAERSGFDDGEALYVDDGDQPLRITATGDDLDPDPAAVRLALAELALGS